MGARRLGEARVGPTIWPERLWETGGGYGREPASLQSGPRECGRLGGLRGDIQSGPGDYVRLATYGGTYNLGRETMGD